MFDLFKCTGNLIIFMFGVDKFPELFFISDGSRLLMYASGLDLSSVLHLFLSLKEMCKRKRGR